jgi:class 3 adenylate cyclase
MDRSILKSREVSYLKRCDNGKRCDNVKRCDNRKNGQLSAPPFVNDLCDTIRADTIPNLPVACCGCTGVAHRPTCTADLLSQSVKNWPKHATQRPLPPSQLLRHKRTGSLASTGTGSLALEAAAGEDDEDTGGGGAPPEHLIFSRGNSKLGLTPETPITQPHAQLQAQPHAQLQAQPHAQLQAEAAPRALITSRALPFTDQMAVNMFLHDSEASLVVDMNCKIVNANFAAYNLFEMNPTADPLKNSNIHLRLSSFPPSLTSSTNLQPGMWVCDRYVDLRDQSKSHEAARCKQLKWCAWRIDIKDSRAPPPVINNVPGADINNVPGADMEDSDLNNDERLAARWMVRVKDVSDDGKLNETVQALRQALLQQKEELGAHAFECIQLREAMLSGRRYKKRLHSTAIIGFLDIQGSTRYDKLETRKLLEYTRRIVGWSWTIDELSVDQSILKLEMVGDAVVFAFGLFDPLLMKTTNTVANNTAMSVPSLTLEGEPDDTKDDASGTATPESPSAAIVATAPTLSGVRPKRLSTTSSMSTVNNAHVYEMRVKMMLSKACNFLLSAMSEALVKYKFKLRAGLHMGVVTTSCCGKKMPKLMVIGTPADFASRLQHLGTPGSIHMSATIAQHYLAAEPKLSIGPSTRTNIHGFQPIDTCLITHTNSS